MNYEVSDIRNVGLISHVGTGKTSLADTMLFNAGQNTRLGKVDNETSLMDCEPEEIKHRTTICSSIATFNWNKKKINLIDTPGAANFIADTKACMQVMDSAVVVLDAIDGLKLQSSKLIKQAEELNLPLAVFINKLERENANYEAILGNLASSFRAIPILTQIPIGQESAFKGIIDLIKMKALYFELDEQDKFKEGDIPIELLEEAQLLRETMLETIVECDDKILERYLEGNEVSEQEIITILKKAVKEGCLVPVMFGSATKNAGVHQLLDFITEYFPSPEDKGIKNSVTSPVSMLVFKTISDPFAGQLSILRLFSGQVNSDSNIFNSTRNSKERIGQLLQLVGKKHTQINHAISGDIIAIPKLKDTHTGDTLCDEKSPVSIPVIPPPNPVISFALKPKSKGDEEKIFAGFKKLMEEDPTLHVDRDMQTKETILSGMGQVHLEIAIEKLKRKYGVEVDLETPKIAYRETIAASTKVQGKYKKQSGGKGQYGDCWIEIQPLERGKGFEFVDKIVGGAIPRQFIPAVETGIREAMYEGVLAGFPATDFKVVLFDGSYHSVDSSEMAFKVAGSMAFKKAFIEAKPVLLEPVMHVDITVPEEYVGDIMGDLNSRRGKMLGIDADGKVQTIKAEIPMAEMLKYAPALNSMTSGSGLFHMEFTHYEEVPAHLAQKILDQKKASVEVSSK